MFDIGWVEMATIAVVALIIIGPKDLPKAMRTVSHWIGKARSLAREFQSGLDDIVRESELQDMRKDIEKAGEKFWYVVDVNKDEIRIKMPSDNSPFGKDTPYGEFSQSEKDLVDLWNELKAGQEDSLNNLFEFLNRIKQQFG